MVEEVSLSTDLSPEELAFRDDVREFLNARCTFDDVRRLESSENGFDLDVWTEMAVRGWTDAVPGTEANVPLVKLALLHHEMGRALCPTPHLWSVVAAGGMIAQCLNNFPNPLTQIRNGTGIATIAISERGPHNFIDHWTTSFDDAKGMISGQKTFVPYATTAEWVVVGAMRGPTRNLCVTPMNSPGITVRPFLSMSRESMASISFDRTPFAVEYCKSLSRDEIATSCCRLL